MKIAIFATNFLPTPPIKEKVIYAPLWLTKQIAEGLAKKGHQVFLFASPDSTVKNVEIISLNLGPFSKNKKWKDCYKNSGATWRSYIRENYEMTLASEMFKMARKGAFDVIQLHSRPRMIHFAKLVDIPVCFTMHDPPNYPPRSKAVRSIFEIIRCGDIKNLFLIGNSHAQVNSAPELNWHKVIHHGIDTKLFAYSEKPKDYLAFAGRLIRQKGADIAIKAAIKTGQKLKIAGEHPSDRKKYWGKKIEPFLSQQITYEGMLDKKSLAKFYQGAKALLMPTLCEETFGLVMAEAMSCGTPVIAFNRGAVPEVVRHGKTGFVVKNKKEMEKSIALIDNLERKDCRDWVEQNFSLQRMIDDYENLYKELVKKTA